MFRVIVNIVIALLFVAAPVHAQEIVNTALNTVVVDDAFVELHTGPGEGYPVFDVAERGESLQLLKRKLDWIKVKAKRDIQGWMSLGEARKTHIAQSGVAFSSVLADELKNQHYAVSISTGEFERDSIFSLNVAYRIYSSFAADVAYSKIVGVYSSSDLFTGGISFSFFPFGKFAPYLKAGVGLLKNTPRTLLVGGEDTTGSTSYAGGGFQYRAQRNLALFTEASVFGLADVNGNQTQYTAWQFGVRALF